MEQCFEHIFEKRIEQNTIYNGKIFNVMRDKIVTLDKKHAIREYIDFPEVVVIVPVLDNGDVVLIMQYRYVIDQVVIELPAGKVEQGEELIDAAKRELQEETGFITDKIEKIHNFYPTCGVSNEKMHLFIAKNLQEVKINPDEDEIIKPYAVPYNQAMGLVHKGKIVDLKTIAGLFLIEQHI